MPTKMNGLAQALIQSGQLTTDQATVAQQQAKAQGLSLLEHLTQKEQLCSHAIAKACADYFGLAYINLQDYPANEPVLQAINEKLTQQHLALAIERQSQDILIAFCDPDDFSIIDKIKSDSGLSPKPVIAAYDQLSNKVTQLLSRRANQSPIHTADLDQPEDKQEAPAILLLQHILEDAIARYASDVHFEPQQQHFQIRLRIDGILYKTQQPPMQLAQAITSRLKILAECDIAERRLPQDGRFTFSTQNGQTRDCRLNCCPTIYGEKLVVRLLDAHRKLLNLEELGLEAQAQHILTAAIKQPQGLMLVTGPTGSGKTLTLYTLLNLLNSDTRNISTVEDPVEIKLPGINQVNVNRKAGLTFAKTLRAFLRQDPDIIMVGEIRDQETADIAIRAAQTGHLVLSTLHTNSAAETLTRLLNMGIEAFNIASAVHTIVAQRLIRKRCQHCRTLQKNSQDPKILANQATQCEHCIQGYQGRMGIFEVMPISLQLKELILNRNNAETLFKQAQQEGMQTLWQAAQNKVQNGITSLEEIHRVIQHNHE